MSSLRKPDVKAATSPLVLTFSPFLSSPATYRAVVDVNAKVAVSTYSYRVAGELSPPRRRPLLSYTDAELAELYAPTAEEDRELASLGLAAWARRLETTDRR